MLLIAVFIALAAFLPPTLAQRGEDFDTCRSQLYSCGDLRNLSYPFYGGSRPLSCGHPGFKLRCVNREYSLIAINGLEFRVLNVSEATNTITVARSDLWGDICSPKGRSLELTNSSFRFARNVQNLNLIYDCPENSGFGKILATLPDKFSCVGNRSSFYLNDSDLNSVISLLGDCRNKIIKIPISRSSLVEIESSGRDESKVLDAIKQGFDMNYEASDLCNACVDSGGLCGFKATTDSFVCLCGGQTEMSLCRKSEHRGDWKVKAGIGAVIGGTVLLLIICITICHLRSKRSLKLWRKSDQDIEAFIKNYGDLSVKRYKFSAVKRMTKSFKQKLGEGGCSVVYKGKLRDGRPVAVKLLNSKGRGEAFVNEVASICRTSHVNIVTLLGFCIQGRKRALIYEYLPNGSLEKFTFKDQISEISPKIEWEKLFQIATGIARGLEYLHRGCKTKILHLDIKPHNILLDEDFCPKISDFGLSKICASKESIVSLMQARGTYGYVAPEVFNRNFGGVSSKSDVYSYGMMILEMVGGRKSIDVEVNHTSKIYFPDWIYKQLEQRSDLQLRSDMTSEENGIARKMIIVGLWCIQTNSFNRPSMSRVIEMLEGRETLYIPPKPTFSLPGEPPEKLPAELAMDSLTSSML